MVVTLQCDAPDSPVGGTRLTEAPSWSAVPVGCVRNQQRALIFSLSEEHRLPDIPLLTAGWGIFDSDTLAMHVLVFAALLKSFRPTSCLTALSPMICIREYAGK